MKVIKSIPRGYCHGVVNALNLTASAIKNYKNEGPIYILGEIVHNEKISKAFLEAGALTLTGGSREELLEKVESGTVIITAHGIDPKLLIRAKDKGLRVIDATCKDVYKTHELIKEYLAIGYSVIYIGKKDHPEPEGVLGISDTIKLVSNIEDINKLKITNENIIITNQTTMSKYDIQKLFLELKKKYPKAIILEEICSATSTRQEIAAINSKKADISFVVGDKNSNNTNKLVEICIEIGNCPTYRIDSVEDIEVEYLLKNDINTVHVTSGASTPTIITTEVIKFIENFDKNDKNTWNNESKIPLNKIIPRIK